MKLPDTNAITPDIRYLGGYSAESEFSERHFRTTVSKRRGYTLIVYRFGR
jgi:hypothetical protein